MYKIPCRADESQTYSVAKDDQTPDTFASISAHTALIWAKCILKIISLTRLLAAKIFLNILLCYFWQTIPVLHKHIQTDRHTFLCMWHGHTLTQRGGKWGIVWWAVGEHQSFDFAISAFAVNIKLI